MRRWTPEERERQSRAIQKWKPWERSTGAKTKDGKNKAKMNALKHGFRSQAWKNLKRILKKQNSSLSEINGNFL